MVLKNSIGFKSITLSSQCSARQKQNAHLDSQAEKHGAVASTFQDSETRPSDYWACQDQLPHLNQPRGALLNETKMMSQFLYSMH